METTKVRKSRFWRRLAAILGIIVGALFLVAVIIFASMDFRTSDADVNKYFSEKGVDVRIRRHQYENKSIRWLETGDTTAKKLIVFVHGAPGSSDNYHQFLADSALLSRACLVAVDRLGYGYSDYGRAETSIAKQADMVKYVCDQYPAADTIILVGHSYGGPIIAKCAVEHPQRLGGIVMLAPVNDPDSEPIFWVAHLTQWKIFRWMLSGGNIVSGDEKMTHVAELRKMLPDWSQLHLPVVHIHGGKDWMAPVANITFSKSHIDNSILKMVEIPKTSHFLPWTDFEAVKKELLDLLQRV